MIFVMSYPKSLTLFIPNYIRVFNSRIDAAAWYRGKTGKDLPAYDTTKPIQHWAETRPAPYGLTSDAGYRYNLIGKDAQGFWRMETDGIPWIIACTPNIPEGMGPDSWNLVPLHKLGQADDGGLEVIASSPFGVEVVSSRNLDNIGLLMIPPDVREAIMENTYVPPGE